MNRNSNFFMDLFEEQRIPDIYSRVRYLDNDLPNNIPTQTNSQKNGAHSVALIPDYFHFENKAVDRFSERTYKQYNLGYVILLNNGFDLDTHLRAKFKGNYRNLKKRQKRLEACFDIRYAVFFGSIEKATYDELMTRLHKMLIRRFQQRSGENKTLDKWDTIVARAYGYINDKKASLFVIYDGDNPIDISLNYHFHKIMFGAVSSYDIDYHKFGLGNLEKLKILEWCQTNNYEILEFGYGDYEYKRVWSNHMYYFKYQVIYDHNSFLNLLQGKMELLKLSIKEYLKKKEVNTLYNRLKDFLLQKRNTAGAKSSEIGYTSIKVNDVPDARNLTKVNFTMQHRLPLKRAVCDFLYSTLEQKDNITVQEVSGETMTFIISGLKNVHKIKFTG